MSVSPCPIVGQRPDEVVSKKIRIGFALMATLCEMRASSPTREEYTEEDFLTAVTVHNERCEIIRQMLSEITTEVEEFGERLMEGGVP